MIYDNVIMNNLHSPPPAGLVKHIKEYYPDVMLADGLDDAILGLVRVFSNTIALYDTEKVIRIYMERDDMDEESAWDFFYYNTAGAYVGETTPAFTIRSIVEV
jgi:hypothetical protein